MKLNNYIQTVKSIKEQILKSRYNITKVANRELLLLYYSVGNTISEKVSNAKWGSNTIEKLSNDLQTELKGLRGFSTTNLKRMKLFYEEWATFINSKIQTTQYDTSYIKNSKNRIINFLESI